MYVNKKPNEPMDKLVHEFVKFVNSKEGQEIVVKDGYYPMPAAMATERPEVRICGPSLPLPSPLGGIVGGRMSLWLCLEDHSVAQVIPKAFCRHSQRFTTARSTLLVDRFMVYFITLGDRRGRGGAGHFCLYPVPDSPLFRGAHVKPLTSVQLPHRAMPF